MCTRLGLRFPGRTRSFLSLGLVGESGVCASSNVRKRGSKADDFEGEVCLCVGRGREPWLLNLSLDDRVRGRIERTDRGLEEDS